MEIDGDLEYWNKLKERLGKEGSQLVTICHQLKMQAADRVIQAPDRESVEATGMTENESSAKSGGGIAKKARVELEAKTGKKVVSGENYLSPSKRKDIAKK